MKIIKSKKFPPKPYTAISLFGFIVHRADYPLKERVIRHETIHFRQQIETLFVGFFIWYGLEYLVRLFIYHEHDRAYRSVSFEAEAYKNDKNEAYLSQRKPFAFLRFLFFSR